jgi:hypothetical protein
MTGEVIDINPWLDDRRPRRQVAQDLAEREGISVAQAMLLLCVAGHETERHSGARRRAPRRLPSTRAEPVLRPEPASTRRMRELLDRLGPLGDGGHLHLTADCAQVQWEPVRGVTLTVELDADGPGVVRAHHPTAGDTHWELDDRGFEYLRTALERLVS